MKALKIYARDNIFNSREAVDIELSGYAVVHGLLDGFQCLLSMAPVEFERLRPESENPLPPSERALEKRLYSLLPSKHLLVYRHMTDNNPGLELVYRTHLIVDYVSGMTDSHALKVFQMLKGISVGVSG